jgi:hypothetical protein
MVARVFSSSKSVGTMTNMSPDREEKFANLEEAWMAIVENWDSYQYTIHSIRDHDTGKTVDRAAIEAEIARRRGSGPTS